ncbi:sensor histidine kinase [Streptomyces sp. NPDC001307]|uniref:sensor histidine kinase n=1 Tax=Streptomyces sp. NPDC001307 TaxID=3364560 RepID=UPI0036B6FCAE
MLAALVVAAGTVTAFLALAVVVRGQGHRVDQAMDQVHTLRQETARRTEDLAGRLTVVGELVKAGQAGTEAALREQLTGWHEALRQAVREDVAAGVADAGRAVPGDDEQPLGQARLLAELTHALRTPLAGLKAQIMTVQTRHDDLDAVPELAGALARIEERAQVCEAVVATFRRLGALADAVPGEYLPSLTRAVRDIHAAAEERTGRGTTLRTDLPESVAGYRNDYLATLLLPLIDNAVEASPPGGTIEVAHRDEEGTVTLQLTNAVQAPVDMEALASPGRSTKGGDHQGLGYPGAQRLAALTRGGRIRAWQSGGSFHVRVSLPAEER